MSNKFDPILGKYRQNDAPDLSGYAKLDGTNQPFTGDIEVKSGLNSKVTVNAEGSEVVYGTGGDDVFDITVGADTYRVHKFTTVGASTFVAPSEAVDLEVLVVGGGGGGASWNTWGGGGGGGAGRYITDTISATPSQSIPVTVGNGGGVGADGGNSVFGDITAAGGGKGAAYGGAGSNGGSGGGGTSAGGSAVGAEGSGNNGAAGVSSPSNAGLGAGGGGGSGGAGGAGTQYTGGTGGAGTVNAITGTSLPYAAGGGGGARSYGSGSGGSGIGGNGCAGSTSSTAGAVNTGSGGGGMGSTGYPYTGAQSGKAGGSGIVIVRYKPPLSTKATPKLVLEVNGTQSAAVYTDPFDGNKLKVDVASTTALTIDPDDQSAVFSGDVSGDNLSGTNTGDQDLSPYATKSFAIAMGVAL